MVVQRLFNLKFLARTAELELQDSYKSIGIW